MDFETQAWGEATGSESEDTMEAEENEDNDGHESSSTKFVVQSLGVPVPQTTLKPVTEKESCTDENADVDSYSDAESVEIVLSQDADAANENGYENEIITETDNSADRDYNMDMDTDVVNADDNKGDSDSKLLTTESCAADADAHPVATVIVTEATVVTSTTKGLGPRRRLLLRPAMLAAEEESQLLKQEQNQAQQQEKEDKGVISVPVSVPVHIPVHVPVERQQPSTRNSSDAETEPDIPDPWSPSSAPPPISTPTTATAESPSVVVMAIGASAVASAHTDKNMADEVQGGIESSSDGDGDTECTLQESDAEVDAGWKQEEEVDTQSQPTAPPQATASQIMSESIATPMSTPLTLPMMMTLPSSTLYEGNEEGGASGSVGVISGAEVSIEVKTRVYVLEQVGNITEAGEEKRGARDLQDPEETPDKTQEQVQERAETEAEEESPRLSLPCPSPFRSPTPTPTPTAAITAPAPAVNVAVEEPEATQEHVPVAVASEEPAAAKLNNQQEEGNRVAEPVAKQQSVYLPLVEVPSEPVCVTLATPTIAKAQSRREQAFLRKVAIHEKAAAVTSPVLVGPLTESIPVLLNSVEVEMPCTLFPLLEGGMKVERMNAKQEKEEEPEKEKEKVGCKRKGKDEEKEKKEVTCSVKKGKGKMPTTPSAAKNKNKKAKTVEEQVHEEADKSEEEEQVQLQLQVQVEEKVNKIERGMMKKKTVEVKTKHPIVKQPTSSPTASIPIPAAKYDGAQLPLSSSSLALSPPVRPRELRIAFSGIEPQTNDVFKLNTCLIKASKSKSYTGPVSAMCCEDGLAGVYNATHLVVGDSHTLKRTAKLLIAINRGVYAVVGVEWLQKSVEAQKALPEFTTSDISMSDSFIVHDKEKEKQWSFSLRNVLIQRRISGVGSLLANCSIYVLPSICGHSAPTEDEFRHIITSAGGNFISSSDLSTFKKNTLLWFQQQEANAASLKSISQYKFLVLSQPALAKKPLSASVKALLKGPGAGGIWGVDMLLLACLRQSLDLSQSVMLPVPMSLSVSTEATACVMEEGNGHIPINVVEADVASGKGQTKAKAKGKSKGGEEDAQPSVVAVAVTSKRRGMKEDFKTEVATLSISLKPPLKRGRRG